MWLIIWEYVGNAEIFTTMHVHTHRHTQLDSQFFKEHLGHSVSYIYSCSLTATPLLSTVLSQDKIPKKKAKALTK